MVAVGFGVTSTKAVVEERHRRRIDAAKQENQPTLFDHDWEGRDRGLLWQSIVTAMYEIDGKLYKMTGEWVEMEMERQKLGFIEPESESESEEEDEGDRET